jgi:membrane glycosyltransferase
MSIETPVDLAEDVNSTLAADVISVGNFTFRRVFIAGLTVVSILGTSSLLVAILAQGKFGFTAFMAVAAFLVNMTWVALGFSNSVIGFFLLRGSTKSSTKVWPELARLETRNPLKTRASVVITARDDDGESIFARIKAIRKSLDKTSSGASFDYFILSDSSMSETIEAEERAIASWQAEDPSVNRRVFYRRRPTNWGFKPGNIRDFCARWGENYEFMVLLDADSIMSGETIVRLVGIMENNPRLGILQSLIVGVLCPSLFARLFEFGHRHALRCSIAGSAWWQGDRCQFWGHNAVIRLAPFTRYCEMPFLPGKGPFSGHISCHDQIEASFMHRAGYEVRVLPEESCSYEGVPPTLFDFNKRNNRWCHGNLKNLRVVRASGLSAIDRFQLMVVAQRFLSQPALVAFVFLAASLAASWPIDRTFPTRMALGLYAIWIIMFFSPKLFGIADAILRSPSQYGGVPRLLWGACFEFLYSLLLAPISAIATTVSIMGLPFKGRFNWDPNRRNAYALTWRAALRGAWPHTLVGIALLIYVGATNASAILWFSPFLLGLIFAIPFATLTSLSSVNSAALRWNICMLPEEIEIPSEITDVVESALN